MIKKSPRTIKREQLFIWLTVSEVFGFVDSLVLGFIAFFRGGGTRENSKYIMVEGVNDRGCSPHSRQEARNEEWTGDQV